MEAIKDIELMNGKTIDIKTKISLGQVKRFQEKGLLKKDFLNKLLTGKADIKGMTMDDFVDSTYVAYTIAGGDMTYDEFIEVCPLDLELLGMIYMQMLLGGRTKQKSQFRKSIEKATKK